MPAGAGLRREQIRGFGLRAGEVTTGSLDSSVYGGVPSSVDADDAGSAGVAATISRSDHQHQATCATPVAVGTVLAEGSAATLARSDHVHELGNGSIDTTAQLADGVLTLAKLSSEAWTSATPTFTNVTLGTGGTSSMHYVRIGRTIHFRAGFTLGSGTGDVSGTITLTLPVNSSAGRRFTGIAAATDASALGATFVGVALITASSLTVFSTTVWGTTSPFDWTVDDEFTVSGTYEASS